jgi:LytR cell envelope-related transcriptional attenuator
MRDELGRLLSTLPVNLSSVDWLAPEQLRRTATRRRRRRLVVTGLATILVLALASTAAASVLALPGPKPHTLGSPILAPTCPGGGRPVDLHIPNSWDEVPLTIYNGTRIDGLAGSVVSELTARGIGAAVGGNSAQEYTGVALIRYGPAAVGAGWITQALFNNQAELRFDLEDSESTVEVTIGTQFDSLGTTTEVNQSLAALGPPNPPPGTCDIQNVDGSPR